MKLTIYEINYSVSPGGKDCWAVEVESDDSVRSQLLYREGFTSAGQALNFLLEQYPERVLEVEVKSLSWYFKNYEEVDA